MEQRIKRKNIFGRLWDGFLFRVRSRKWLIDELTKANRQLNIRANLFTDKIIGLEQTKTYVIRCDVDEVETVKIMLNSARLQMKWTLPNILVTTRELEVKEK